MMWPGVDGSPLPSPVVVSPGGSVGDWSGTPAPSASGSGSLPGCVDDQPVSGASCADSSGSPVPTVTSTVTIEPSASPAAFDSEDAVQWSANMEVVAAGIILLVLFAAIRTVAGFRRDR